MIVSYFLELFYGVVVGFLNGIQGVLSFLTFGFSDRLTLLVSYLSTSLDIAKPMVWRWDAYFPVGLTLSMVKLSFMLVLVHILFVSVRWVISVFRGSDF